MPDKPKYILIELREECVPNLSSETLTSVAAQFSAPGPIMAKSVSIARHDGFGRIVTVETKWVTDEPSGK